MKGELINITRAWDLPLLPEHMAGALPTELGELLKNKVIELSSYVKKVRHPVFVVIITSSAPKITTFRHQNPN